MNQTIAELHARKSVRAYTDTPISPALKREILLAAMAAPTAGNEQLYTILDITDEELKQRLSVTCDNQPFIAKAPLVLVFCADFQKWLDAYSAADCGARPVGPGDLFLAMQDAVIAAQNAVTAAWSLGIGSCYIGDIMENAEQHQQLLRLPPAVMPATMVVFGYPTQQQAKREKPERFALEDVVQQNTYHRRSEEELVRMFQVHTGETPFTQWMNAFCARKYNSGFARELNRSAQMYLRAVLPQDERG